MGYSIAKKAMAYGADVILISGPTNLTPPKGAQVISVESAEEMYNAVMTYREEADIIIKTAAVSDYKPTIVYDHKVKSKVIQKQLNSRTQDILSELGKRKEQQILIGFAAETQNMAEYAMDKLKRKNADMIVANNVNRQDSGFGTDTNLVTMYKRDGTSIELPLLSKDEVAEKILEQAMQMKEAVQK